MTRITEIVVGFENIRRPPSGRDSGERNSESSKEPERPLRCAAATSAIAIRLLALDAIQDGALLGGRRSFA